MPKNIFKIYDGRNHFWQWDRGQKIIVQQSDITELQFSNSTMAEAVRSDIYEQNGLHICDIPDLILEVAQDLIVYACIVGEDFSKTVYCAKFSVVPKPEPSDWFNDSEMLPSDWFATIKYVDDKLNDIQVSGGGVSKEEVQAMIDEIKLTPGPEGQPGKDGQDGTSVTIVSTTLSDEDGGDNIIAFSDGNTVVIKNGSQGKQGEKGETGAAGQNGISVTKTEINTNGELVITLSNDSVFNLGVVVGSKGEQGSAGKDGADGLTPYINDNGTWQIGDVDTGVKAEGVDGSKGDQGEKGETGEQGQQGIQGEDGVGIDEIYIQDGNLYVKKTTDPEAISLGSVKGDKGDQGPQGPQGDKGEPGASGVDGKSAYEIAVDKGFEGNEEEWLDSLKNAADLTDYATTNYVDSTVGDIQKTLSLMVGGV